MNNEVMIKYNKKYKTKLLIMLLGISIIPAVIISAVLLKQSVSGFESEITSANEQTVNSIKEIIIRSMTGAEISIKSIGDTLEIGEITEDEKEIMLKTVENSEIISQIYVMDELGMQVYKTSGELGDRGERAYFKEAIKGNLNYSDVLISGSTNQPIIVLAMPTKNGEGVIGASINLSGLYELLKHYEDGLGSYGFIVERNGLIIAHMDSSLVEEMSDVTFLEPVERVMKGETGILEYEYDGGEKLSAYSYMESTGWGIVVQKPVSVAFKTANKQKVTVVILIGILVVISVLTALYAANNIIKPIKTVTKIAEEVAEGNLSVVVDPKLIKRGDEFGKLAYSFEKMISSTKDLLFKMVGNSDKIDAQVDILSENTNHTSLAIEEVANSAMVLATDAQNDMIAIQASAENTEKVAEGSLKVSELAVSLNTIVNSNEVSSTEGLAIMQESLEKLDITHKTSLKIKTQIGVLSKAAEDIGEITNAIKNISDQTDLLALNAAIEAARAGESGRGFAVVAGEIRKLSEESTKFANNIAEIILNIQKDVSETSSSFDIVMGELDETVVHMGILETKVTEIAELSSEASESAKEINSISEVQAKHTSNMRDEIGNLLKSIEKTGSTTETISASVEEQTAATEQISAMVDDFKVLTNQLVELSKHFKL